MRCSGKVKIIEVTTPQVEATNKPVSGVQVSMRVFQGVPLTSISKFQCSTNWFCASLAHLDAAWFNGHVREWLHEA